MKIKKRGFMLYLLFFGLSFINITFFPHAVSMELLSTPLNEDKITLFRKSDVSIKEENKIDIKNVENNSSRYILVPSMSENLSEDSLYKNFLSLLSLKISDLNCSDLDEPSSIKWTRRTAKGIATIFGITAGVSFFEPACMASSRLLLTKNSALCYVSGMSIIASYGGVVTWAGFRLADRIRSSTPDARMLEERFIAKKNGFMNHMAANFLGAVACIPGVYLVYKYNSEKWFVFPTVVVDYILKTEGAYTLINALTSLIKNKQCLPNEKQSHSFQLKQILVDKLYKMLSSDNFNNKEVQKEAINSIKELLISNAVVGKRDEYNAVEKLIRSTIQVSSLIFPLGQEFIRINLTNGALNYFIKPFYFRIPLSILISLPSFALNTLASTQSSGGIFDMVYEKYNSTKKPSFIGYFFPKTNFCIYTTSIMLAALSTAADAYIAYDTVSNSNFAYLTYFLVSLVVMNNFIFDSFALTSVYQDIAMEAIAKLGPNNLKQGVIITRAYEFANNVINQLEMSSFDENDPVQQLDDVNDRL